MKLDTKELLAAADAADAAANATNTQQEMKACMRIFAHKEAIQMGLINQRLNRLSQNPHGHERRPLIVEGEELGRVEARIPRGLFFHLMQQKNFGYEGFTSDEGMRDLLKTHPGLAVTTRSGKTVVGWRSPQSTVPSRGGRWAGTRRVRFDRTVNL